MQAPRAAAAAQVLAEAAPDIVACSTFSGGGRRRSGPAHPSGAWIGRSTAAPMWSAASQPGRPLAPGGRRPGRAGRRAGVARRSRSRESLASRRGQRWRLWPWSGSPGDTGLQGRQPHPWWCQ